MGDVESLAKKRAETAGDCRLWSASDCLEDLLKDIKSGAICPGQLVVHWFEAPDEDGSKKHHYAMAGVTIPEHIGLLNLGLHRVIREWSGE